MQCIQVAAGLGVAIARGQQIEIGCSHAHVQSLVQRFLRQHGFRLRRLRQIGQALGQLQLRSERAIQTQRAHQPFTRSHCRLPGPCQLTGRLGVERLLPGPLQLAEVASLVHALGEFCAGFGRVHHLLKVGERLLCRNCLDPGLARIGRGLHHPRRTLQPRLLLHGFCRFQARGQIDEFQQRDGQHAADVEIDCAIALLDQPFEREHGIG